mgnify:CR=1 FL=1
MSLAETTETLFRKLLLLPTLGLGKRLHALPFQRCISVLPVKLESNETPTAHMLFGETTATSDKRLVFFPALGLLTTR